MFRKHKPNPPSWRFAPTGGGAEQGNSPGMQTFKEDAMAAMVREVLQNSLDQRVDGLPQVTVRFVMRELPPALFGARQLLPHVESSLAEAERDGNEPMIRRLRTAQTALRARKIRVLSMTDSGTIGLRDERWNNLIFKEGAPNAGANAGGSFGFGKNAPFNLSDANVVFYTTRYMDRNAKFGRGLYMAGRAILMSHDDSNGKGRLQSVGFYAAHGGKDDVNGRIEGEAVPVELAPEQYGAGVHIVGFSRAARRWGDDVARAAVENFFCAIHWGTLRIVIAEDSGDDRIIDADSLPIEIERLGASGRAARAYYETLRDQRKIAIEGSGVMDGIGGLSLWLATGDEEAVNRLCYVNRKGMKITDARLFGKNPFSPAGGAGWQPWTAVAIAAADDGESRLRRLEPPAHNEVSYKLLDDASERGFMESELRAARAKIAAAIKERFGEDNAASRDNASELAELFPDSEDGENAESVEFKNLPPAVIKRDDGKTAYGYGLDDEDEGDDEDEREPGGGGGGGGGGGARDRKRVGGAADARVERALRLGGDEMLIVIDAGEAREVALGVVAAGEQFVRGEPRLPFRSARLAREGAGDVLVDARGNLALRGINGRVSIVARLERPPEEYAGFRVVNIGDDND